LADGSGFEVWDQNWDLTGVLGTHTITTIGSADFPTTLANNYNVVQIKNPVQTNASFSASTSLGTNTQQNQVFTGTIAKSGDYQDFKFSGKTGDISQFTWFRMEELR